VLIGSSRHGRAAMNDSLKAKYPAIWNAMSFESPDASCHRKSQLLRHDSVARQNAFFRRFHNAFFHGGHKNPVHVLAGQRLREFQPGVSWLGFDSHPDFRELARAARLLLVAVLRITLALMVSR